MAIAKTYTCLIDLITDIVKTTKRRADIAEAVGKALAEAGEFVPHGTEFTVHFGDTRNPTHLAEAADGVEVEYLNDTVLAYRFPAHAVVQGAWSQ